MYVCCDYCVSSGRGFCVGLITHPEESDRVWCVWVWSWNLDNEEAMAQWKMLRQGGGESPKTVTNSIRVLLLQFSQNHNSTLFLCECKVSSISGKTKTWRCARLGCQGRFLSLRASKWQNNRESSVKRFLISLFNNQPYTLIIQIYSVIKLYMFRTTALPIIRSSVL
jgi:hypothetical protein